MRIAAILLAGLAGLGTAGAAGAAAVEISGSAFSPDAVTIANGESVEWTNLDNLLHTVTFDAFGSGALGQDDTYLRVFDDPGQFDYVCTFHFGMAGTVDVQAVPGAPTAAAVATPAQPLRGQTVTFDGSGSTAEAGDTIASWSWDFGGGATASGESVGHAFGSAGRREVVLTVEDDDGQTDRTRISVTVRLPALRIANAAVREGNRGTRGLRFVVRLSAPVTYPVTVAYRTRPGTAKSPGDFAARNGRLTFNPGQTTRTVTVPVRGDRRAERNEKLSVVLSKPAGARLADATGVGTIRDDD